MQRILQKVPKYSGIPKSFLRPTMVGEKLKKLVDLT